MSDKKERAEERVNPTVGKGTNFSRNKKQGGGREQCGSWSGLTDKMFTK